MYWHLISLERVVICCVVLLIIMSNAHAQSDCDSVMVQCSVVLEMGRISEQFTRHTSL